MLGGACTCRGADLRQRPPRAAARPRGKRQEAPHLRARGTASAAAAASTPPPLPGRAGARSAARRGGRAGTSTNSGAMAWTPKARSVPGRTRGATRLLVSLAGRQRAAGGGRPLVEAAPDGARGVGAVGHEADVASHVGVLLEPALLRGRASGCWSAPRQGSLLMQGTLQEGPRAALDGRPAQTASTQRLSACLGRVVALRARATRRAPAAPLHAQSCAATGASPSARRRRRSAPVRAPGSQHGGRGAADQVHDAEGAARHEQAADAHVRLRLPEQDGQHRQQALALLRARAASARRHGRARCADTGRQALRGGAGWRVVRCVRHDRQARAELGMQGWRAAAATARQRQGPQLMLSSDTLANTLATG